MNKAVFITGTDTGVGKTVIAGLLGRFLSENGIKTVTQKWIQTGCKNFSGDILEHTKIMGEKKSLAKASCEKRVPYILDFPASPHLSALLERKKIQISRIEKAFWSLAEHFDFIIVEGAGGFLVPINDKKTIADIVKKLKLSVVIVAENRLGAINQTLLTIEALKSRGIEIIGIVFNRLRKSEDDLILKDNIKTVETFSGEKILGELHCLEDRDILYKMFMPIGENIIKVFRKEKKDK
ncbi:MAG: dethiobiotin synthase [Candidatus Omnitrophota bacterium]